MNVGFVSLGCSKNLIDTECLIGTFRTNCPGYVYSASCPPPLVASVRYMIRYANKII